MKKTNKILGGLFAVLLVGTFGTNVVKAETLDDLGSEGKDATIQNIVETDVYSVDIKWGSLTYTYYKVSDNNYEWHMYSEDYGPSNYVDIINNSTKSIKATFDFTPSITGVIGLGYHDDTIEGKGQCVDASGLIATTPTVWSDEGTSGTYRMSSNREELLYSNDVCGAKVETGEAYDSTKTYYTVSLTATRWNNNAVAILNAPILPANADFTIVGSQNQTHPLVSKTRFVLDLQGGNPDDVKAAYNTEDKKIGTVTITITDVE